MVRLKKKSQGDGMNRVVGAATMALALMACDAMAQPAGPYALAEGGHAVLDRTTGLVWKRCQEGKQWDGRFCKGIGKELGWEDARRASNGAWRLPSAKELKTLTRPANSDGATVDGAAFPDTDPGLFWSASPSDNDPAAAWTVDFEKGVAFGFAKRSYKSHVRLVRDAQPPDMRQGAPAAIALPARVRFVLADHGGTVIDHRTGLAWKRCQEGKQWRGAACEGAGRKLNWHDATRAGAGGWRPPQVGELKSLLEWRRTDHETIDPRIFPGTESGVFWSASPSDTNPGAAWTVDFGKGYAFGNETRYTPAYLRLVRTAP